MNLHTAGSSYRPCSSACTGRSRYLSSALAGGLSPPVDFDVARWQLGWLSPWPTGLLPPRT